jgi:hypothetical protein
MPYCRFEMRIIRGACSVREIFVVDAVVACVKLPLPKFVSCAAINVADVAGPTLFNGKNDSASIPTDNLIVVPEGTQIISPSKNPSPTP